MADLALVSNQVPMAEVGHTALRPQRIPALHISPFNSEGQKPRFIVKDETETHYLLTNQVGVILLQFFDGQHSPEEIQSAFAQRYPLDLSLEKIASFADLCHRNNLLVPGSWEGNPSKPKRTHTYRRNLGFYKRLFTADQVVDWLVSHRAWWCNPIMLLVGLLCVGAALMFALHPPPTAGFVSPLHQVQRNMSDLYLLALPFVFLVQLSLHELAHSVVCRLFGAKPGGFGFGLLWGVVPIFFTDTTDAYTIDNKYRRMLVSAAGPLVDLVCLGITALVAWLSPSGSLAARLALAYSALPLTMLLINLNPFLIRMDGYWILADWLEQPNLRQTALRYLWRQIRGLFGRVDQPLSLDVQPSQQWHQHVLYGVYGIVAVGWTVAFIVAYIRSFVVSIQQFVRMF